VREGDTITPAALSQISAIRSYSIRRDASIVFSVAGFNFRFVLGGVEIYPASRHRSASRAFGRKNLRAVRFYRSGADDFDGDIFPSRRIYRRAERQSAAQRPDFVGVCHSVRFRKSFDDALLADRRTALFTGLFTSLLAGLLAPRGLEFILYSTISSAVAVYGIGRYRSRQSVTIAGVLVGLSSAIIVSL
jgi:hypothetical protein